MPKTSNMDADTTTSGPFEDSWDSLENYQIPKWYMDSKFAIFIHWGLYSVPAFENEWYPRLMYQEGSSVYEHHVKTYGSQKDFGYKDFIPMFTAENYDPGEWARLFKESGARFVVPVAEHHDGFQMYDSDISEWNAFRMGPKRDLIGELAEAVRAEDIAFGVSSHRAEHWWFFDGGMRFDSDVRDPAYIDFYGPAQKGPTYHQDHLASMPDEEFLEDWLARNCELVDKYQPQIFWFDWWIMNLAFKPYLKKFAAYYYNKAKGWGKGVAINYKLDTFPVGTAVFDVERGQLTGIRSLFWQTDTSVSKNSWGYINGHDYKTANDIICDLVDIVSKNGALLLNVGPKSDGTIPEQEQDILRSIGKWLNVNGEAIFGTHPYQIFGEGPTKVYEGAFTDTHRSPFTSEDIRFTCKDGILYATVLKCPENGIVNVTTLGNRSQDALAEILDVAILGGESPVSWSCSDHALRIETTVKSEQPIVFKIVYRASN
ncbi:alpha-L-fucosidase [Alicyclobacillus fastidiosus]|uniref:alpha-L-fucosidase n=1 Tax=Alicyclobacillus fastidiosus TaxID=392011 RepID=A0ABY6ZAQ1_9BACL|nr:alpha-L-fucosidase [Alicyclobacillus fastidiosus]WAH39838.1 alpha-L-fucosidase [Alicyclobacillus fastidiosus]GMA61094.1 alpha-L-fucosidase [Alicyclobacillus fastidiosus]